MVQDAPLSQFAESLRSIKVAVDLNQMVRSNPVVGFTSSLPDEGKSTVATSLAQLIAHSGGRVILVDCDLRNPSLSRQLAPNASTGLLEVLSGSASLSEAVWTDPATNLTFLPAVMRTRLSHTMEVLSSDQLKRLFDSLREKFDYVIVDLSPLAPVVDVRAMTHLVDSFVFVIEWGKTRIDVVEQALGAARGVYDNLLGVVLNKADMSALRRYGASRGYYTNRNYSRYGYTEN
jgi:succinoglycan biosynthesis transport protein ExoP